MDRITQKELTRISKYELDEKDRFILEALHCTRSLISSQICSLLYANQPSYLVAIKRTIRRLNRLKELGLIDHYERQFGGVRAGSKSYIWYLDEPGYRLLVKENKLPSKRYMRPSLTNINHRSAVAETWVQIDRLSQQAANFSLENIIFEPENWRYYRYRDETITLKPDLYISTRMQDTKYHWFIEMDLDTEQISTVMKKCRRYHEYLTTGDAQKHLGVFPIVVWIVPSEKRKELITKELSLWTTNLPKIFLVITPDQLKDLMLVQFPIISELK